MKVIVGLGNPGEEYASTRHNVGFMVLEEISKQIDINKIQRKYQAEIRQTEGMLLVKPQTYMNRSGEAVRKITAFYKITLDNLIIIHDDLDIKLGDYKIQLGKGPKIHNGVNSIEQALGSSEFWRIRIGVDNRTQKISGEEYVLGKFMPEEKSMIDKVIGEVNHEFIHRYL